MKPEEIADVLEHRAEASQGAGDGSTGVTADYYHREAACLRAAAAIVRRVGDDEWGDELAERYDEVGSYTVVRAYRAALLAPEPQHEPNDSLGSFLSHASIAEALKRGERDTFPAPEPQKPVREVCRWMRVKYKEGSRYENSFDCQMVHGLRWQESMDALWHRCPYCGKPIQIEGGKEP